MDTRTTAKTERTEREKKLNLCMQSNVNLFMN